MAATGNIGSTGHVPTVIVGPAKKKGAKVQNISDFVSKKVTGNQVAKLLDINLEQQKYIKVWKLKAYGNTAPGEDCVPTFLEMHDSVQPDLEDKQDLIDFGCGTGRGGYKLWQTEKFNVTLMDFAYNCLDDNIKARVEDKTKGLRFVEHDITKKISERYDWGYCCDVMEHLPEDHIDDALQAMFESCDNLFFQIATIPENFGDHPDIQEELHLSVHNYTWWLKRFADLGVVVHRSIEAMNHVLFCVSGYQGFAYNKMKMNTPPEDVFKNIRTNLGKGLKTLRPFNETPNQKVIVLGGGPSLNDYVDEIKEHKKNGAKIITMNGTYAWAKEHDLWPVTHFQIDAREFNTRFVDPVDEQNLYIISAQCHPDLIDKLPPDRTYLSLCNLDEGSIEIYKEFLGQMYDYENGWFPILGGSTVMLRCLPALFMLGFRDAEIYGFDSCMMGVQSSDHCSHAYRSGNCHHAYSQPENDIPDGSDRVAKIRVKDKHFYVESWQLCQANEFIHTKNKVLRGMELKVHGDGLIAYCIETGVDILEDQEK